MTSETAIRLEESAVPIILSTSSTKSNKSITKGCYNDKKPKWWQQLSRKATKSQRRAMAAIRDTHQVPRPSYGQKVDVCALFGNDGGSIPNISGNCDHSRVVDQPSLRYLSLELGFGAGENLLASAQSFPDRSFLGAEIHQPGVGRLCQIIQESMERKEFYSGHTLYDSKMANGSTEVSTWLQADSISHTLPLYGGSTLHAPYSNLRFFIGDGIKLLSFLPDACLQYLLITFPDPFPDGEQWRLIQVETVRAMRRVLDRGGRLFLATDHDGYYEWSCRILEQKCGDLFSVVDPCPNREYWLPVVSSYEAKGWKEGRTTKTRCWEAK